MGIREALAIVNEMEDAGIIRRYAVGGAVAAYNYIEPTVTNDLDLLVAFGPASVGGSGLLSLQPIISFLASKGFTQFEMEGIVVCGWPVQFLPVATSLDEEALREAEAVELAAGAAGEAIKTRIMRAEHVVATALRVGRPKDFVRVSQFLSEKAVDLVQLEAVLGRHGLLAQWQRFRIETGQAGHTGA